MDEIDSLALSRNSSSGSGENHKTTGTLLKLIESSRDNGIIVIATTNMINSLDEALKQRFDKTHYLILSGFELMSVNYILCSIYWSLIADTMLWFIFGILTAFVFRYKKANIVKIGAKE